MQQTADGVGDGGVGAVEALRNFMNAGDAVFLRRPREFSANAGMAPWKLRGQVLHYEKVGFEAEMLDCKT